MTYALTPITAPAPATEFPPVTVRVINFTGNVIVTRGTGEKSNVITVRQAAPTPAPVCSPNLVDAQDFTVYGGMSGNTADQAVGVTSSVSFNPDGTVVGHYVNSVGDTPAVALGWYAPTTGGIGAGYWVRFTLLSGDTPNVGGSAALGVWLPLSVARTLMMFASSGTVFAATGDLRAEISPDAGVTICTTWTGTIGASAIYF